VSLVSPRSRHAILVAAQVVVLIVTWRALGHDGLSPHLGSDAAGFRSLVVMHGTPYRDFNVVYPPLALVYFKLLGPASIGAFVRHLIISNVVAQLLVVWMCFRGWGRRAGWSYLALSLPLMPFMYFHYDLWGVVFALGGLLLLQRRHAGAAAASWVVGAFMKMWPAVLFPSLLAKGEKRAFVGGIVGGVAGATAWVAWGGLGAPGEVLTYGGSRGWEFESAPGSLLRLLTRGELRNEGGALRLGAPPRIFGLLLTCVLVAAVVGTWVLVAQRGARPGVAEVVVIGSAMVFSTLLSAQFMIWVVPFVAIAAAEGAVRIERWTAAASAFTFLYWWLYDPNHADALNVELAIAARNIAVIGMLVVAARELLATRPSETAAVVEAPAR
jgi:hypothetical protein